MLHQRGQFDRSDVDMSFEMPTKLRVEALVHPTINLFLYGRGRRVSLSLRQATRPGGRQPRGGGGRQGG